MKLYKCEFATALDVTYQRYIVANNMVEASRAVRWDLDNVIDAGTTPYTIQSITFLSDEISDASITPDME